MSAEDVSRMMETSHAEELRNPMGSGGVGGGIMEDATRMAELKALLVHEAAQVMCVCVDEGVIFSVCV